MQVITKTTTKLVIKLYLLKIELQSEESKQMQELKNKIQELEAKV